MTRWLLTIGVSNDFYENVQLDNTYNKTVECIHILYCYDNVADFNLCIIYQHDFISKSILKFYYIWYV